MTFLSLFPGLKDGEVMNEPSFPPSPRKAEKWDVKPLPTVPLLSPEGRWVPREVKSPHQRPLYGPKVRVKGAPGWLYLLYLLRTRLTTGWPHVSSPALARTSTVTLSLVT